MNSSYYVDTSYGLSSTSGLFGAIAAAGIILWIIVIAVLVLQIIAMWKLFEKAGKPGWAAIIPIYNTYIMCEIGEKAWWYVLLTFIPIVNVFALFIIYNGIAKKFGKGIGFTIGMFLLPPIFFMILGFGKSNVIIDNNVNDVSDNITENSIENVITNQSPNFEKKEDVITNNNSDNFQDVSNQGYVAPSFENANTQNNNQTINNMVNPAMNETQIMNNMVNPTMNETPVMNNTVNPVMNEAPAMNNTVNPATNETPIMNNTVNPVMNEAPVMNNTVNPVMNEAPVMNNTVNPVMNEAPAMNNMVNPVMNEAPVMDNTVNPVMNEAPAMNNMVNPVMNEAPAMNNMVNPVMNEAPAMDTVNPVMNNQPINESVSNQEFETLDTKPRTSLWSNNNNNNGQV